MVKFPIEGKCQGLHQDLIEYLEKRPKAIPYDSKMTKDLASGIGWNSRSYWYLKNVKNSSKKLFLHSTLKDLFFKPKTIGLW